MSNNPAASQPAELRVSDAQPAPRLALWRRFLLCFVAPSGTAAISLIAFYGYFGPKIGVGQGPNAGAGGGILALGILVILAVSFVGALGGLLGSLASVFVHWENWWSAISGGFKAFVGGAVAGVLVLFIVFVVWSILFGG